MFLCRENSSNDFFLSFLVQEQRKLKFSPKIIRGEYVWKNNIKSHINSNNKSLHINLNLRYLMR